MSCDNKCYLPNPPRAWSRVQHSCSFVDISQQSNQSESYLRSAMLNKGNILQYKKNSSNLTKQQRYAQIAKGLWTNRNTTWATQSSRGYTNPNNKSLQRVNSINITLDGVPTTNPVTCVPPVNLNEPIVIQDFGTLICGTYENVCTGVITQQPTDIICHPTTDSDVPGQIIELCWNDGTPTWYPKQQYIMTNSGNKWPVNATLLSSIKPSPPIITSISNIDQVITLNWTQDVKCLPVTNFTIFQNELPINIVLGNTFTESIFVENNGSYTFYIVGTNGNIVSDPSNIVSITVNN
jgi:hypothetical protein